MSYKPIWEWAFVIVCIAAIIGAFLRAWMVGPGAVSRLILLMTASYWFITWMEWDAKKHL